METRERFEALPYIKDKLDSIYYCEDIECYTEKKGYRFCSISSWVNGAWFAFQEQEKKLAICEKLRDSQFDKLMAIKELCMERRGDIHWQVDVFIREVGGLLDESKPQ